MAYGMIISSTAYNISYTTIVTKHFLRVQVHYPSITPGRTPPVSTQGQRTDIPTATDCYCFVIIVFRIGGSTSFFTVRPVSNTFRFYLIRTTHCGQGEKGGSRRTKNGAILPFLADAEYSCVLAPRPAVS